MALPRHLKIGVVLFPQNFPLDWVGPTDILNTLRPSRTALPDLDLSISLTLLAESLDPVQTSGGWSVVPQKTFDQAREEEWDGILVPGGSGARPWAEGNQAAQEFIKLIGPTCKVVLTVCTGSFLVAHTGLLNGQKATTNKSAYTQAKEHTADKGVTWVPKARWVVSDKFWTSSGVSAGIDMASAFLRHFLRLHLDEHKAKEAADQLLGVIEVIENDKEEDPWAEYYKLS